MNHAPSFSTDTPFDKRIKSNLIKDSIKLIHLDSIDREKYYIKQKKLNQKRIEARNPNSTTYHHCNSNINWNVNSNKTLKELKQQKKEKYLRKREEYEFNQITDYVLIYPDNRENSDNYSQILESAKNIWEEFTSGKKKKKIESDKNNSQILKTIIKKQIKSLVNSPLKHPDRNEMNQNKTSARKNQKVQLGKSEFTPNNILLSEQEYSPKDDGKNLKKNTNIKHTTSKLFEFLSKKHNEISQFLSSINEKAELSANTNEKNNKEYNFSNNDMKNKGNAFPSSKIKATKDPKIIHNISFYNRNNFSKFSNRYFFLEKSKFKNSLSLLWRSPSEILEDDPLSMNNYKDKNIYNLSSYKQKNITKQTNKTNDQGKNVNTLPDLFSYRYF